MHSAGTMEKACSSVSAIVSAIVSAAVVTVGMALMHESHSEQVVGLGWDGRVSSTRV